MQPSRVGRGLSRPLLAFLLVAAAPLSLSAQDDSVFDGVWGLRQWYENEGNALVQSIRLSGRFQYEYARVEDGAVSHDEWNVRRMRLGIRAGLFRDFLLHVETDLDPQDRDPLYLRLTDAYLEWSRSTTLAVTVGKQGVPFTMDGSTSSRSLLTIDRSNLANNMWFPQEYLPGMSVSGEAGRWMYQIGVYSAGEANREFGELNAGAVALVLLGYDLADALGADRALLRGTYVYQRPDPANTFTRPHHHVGSVFLDYGDGRLGVRADVSAAAGYLGQSDLWGAMLMPWLDVTSKLQLVGRYTRVASSDPNGVRFARYESELVSGRGDTYDELYLGANYYFYGHELKLQGGLTLAEMQDEANDGGSYSGVGATVGVRVSW